jgi:hypothetical protein
VTITRPVEAKAAKTKTQKGARLFESMGRNPFLNIPKDMIQNREVTVVAPAAT